MKTLVQIFLAIVEVLSSVYLVYVCCAFITAMFVLTAGMQFVVAFIMLLVYGLIIGPAVGIVFAKIRAFFGLSYESEKRAAKQAAEFEEVRAQFQQEFDRNQKAFFADNF